MGSVFYKPQNQLEDEETGARELGLKNNLRQIEVKALIDYYKEKDPENVGLLPEQFNEATGTFIATELTIDPKILFNIFNIAESGVHGRITMREFILGYAILCRGSAESRLKYLFALYRGGENVSFLTREQLISALNLMYRIVTEISGDGHDENDANQVQVEDVADELITESKSCEKNEISYDDFVEQLLQSDVVREWIDKLSVVTGDHLKFIEEREVQLVELSMQREGILGSDTTTLSDSPRTADVKWSSQPPPVRVEKKRRLPMPKKQKLVRRDISSKNADQEQSGVRKNPEVRGFEDHQVDAAMPFLINYEHIEFGKVLGRGACATVYQSEWMHLPVAVKVFNDSYGDPADVDQLSSSQEEMRKAIVGDYVEEFWLLLQIRHPNCLLYLGICFEPIVCIVTELYAGGSVENYLHGPNSRKFSPSKAVELLADVARGMFYLHASSPSIMHRDLKASNILINRSLTNCVICDFGLSSQFVNDASRINLKEGQKSGDGNGVRGVGTPYTMAPEVMRGEKYTPAADVFSFGVVSYEMYTGRFPFPKMKPMQLMFYVSEGNRPKFHDSDKVPSQLKVLIERCWDPSPTNRPSFEEILKVLVSKELKEELERLSEGEEILQDTQPPLASSSEFNRNAHTDDGNTSKQLLDLSFDGDYNSLLKLISQGADVNYCDYDKRTALHVASAEGRIECMRALLRSGAKLLNDRWNNSPIVDALRYFKRTGNSEPLRLLRAFQTKNEDVRQHVRLHVGEKVEQTAFITNMIIAASGEGDLTTLRNLLEDGHDANIADYDGRTALMVAASDGKRDVVHLLLQYDASPRVKDRWGMNAIQEAERCGHHDIHILLKNHKSKRNMGVTFE